MCTETSLSIKKKGVEFSCHVLTGGGTDHLIWRAHRQNAYLIFSCQIFTSHSFHFISPNLKRSFRQNTHAKHRITLLYLCMLLLSMSSDIEVNQGPDTTNASQVSADETKYPCGYCNKEVALFNVMSLMCDNCDVWFHADCQGIGNTTFDILGQSKATWHCNQCKFPNYSHGLFESLDTLSNTSVLSLSVDSSFHSSMTGQLDSRSPKPPDTPGPPQATSSPKISNVNKNKTKQKHIPKRLTIVNINCRSIVEKRTELK